MAQRKTIALVIFALVLASLAYWWFAGRGPAVETTAYTESFDAPGTWTVGDDPNASASVHDGVYELFVELTGDVFWGSAGRNFADGVYEVEATPLEGAINNGYGLLFRINNEDKNFYMFKVSSDGYVWIGRCRNNCAEAEALVEQDWFASAAVAQGLGTTNHLRVIAGGPEMAFFVNDTEVGRATDDTLPSGDVGLIAETFTPEGLRVAFDNFKFTPD
ncbi:MAG: hypothetical protein L0332_33810 [Chloroflexi bacterium]|nr:hypothetical protein [Chloroflexota bacterium]MCI0576422.1 hypothetical protein [Chloroflexota bacterium]MCI0643291.1 hypothetical protein [Chloroflexota bacterium]MCI0731678.1 hypothetical protein [Chloroflexota bacterium]